MIPWRRFQAKEANPSPIIKPRPLRSLTCGQTPPFPSAEALGQVLRGRRAPPGRLPRWEASAMTRSMKGHGQRDAHSCGTAARGSCMSAGDTQATSSRPAASTRMWRFNRVSFLPPSYPFVPPVWLVLTDWLSMIAAEGEAPRPSRSRSSITRRGVDPLAQTRVAPSVEVALNRGVGREGLGQRAPWAAQSAVDIARPPSAGAAPPCVAAPS